MAVRSDITISGRFGEEWLLCAPELIVAYTIFDGKALERNVFKMADLAKLWCNRLAGSNECIVELKNGQRLRILLFTNTLKTDMAGFAAQINRLIDNGASATESSVDVTDENAAIESDNNPLPQHRIKRYLKRGSHLFRIFSFARPYAWLIGLLFVLLMATTAVGLCMPYISKILIDTILKPDRMGVYLHAQRLLPLMGVMVGAGVLQLILGALHERVSGTLGYKTIYDVRSKLYAKLQELSLSYFDRHSSGALMARVNQDSGDMQRLIVDFLPLLAESVLLLCGVGILLFVFSWQITTCLIVPVLLLVLFIIKIYPGVQRFFKRYFELRSRLSSHVNDSLAGIRVVKSFGMEQLECSRFDTMSGAYRDAGIALVKRWSVYHPVLQAGAMFGGILVWYLGGNQIFANKMTIGSVVAYSGYLAMFFGPLMNIIRSVETVATSLAAAERVFEVIDAPCDIKDSVNPKPVDHIAGAIEFRNVVFGYDVNKPVLKGVSFSIKPHEKVGLVGLSGAGKTTIINLLCRLYDVTGGTVLIDGNDIRTLCCNDFKKHIGVVLQDTFLFDGTIFENITYARPDAARADVVAAAMAAHAHEFIMQKADGYDSIVGERGVMLSGGEKQRIAIARAILRNPAILILDEATSAVDTRTEQHIQLALEAVSRNRTTIAIAHRLSTLRSYDRLLVVENGVIVENGSHAELMQRQGVFYKLVTMQQELSQIIIDRKEHSV